MSVFEANLISMHLLYHSCDFTIFPSSDNGSWSAFISHPTSKYIHYVQLTTAIKFQLSYKASTLLLYFIRCSYLYPSIVLVWSNQEKLNYFIFLCNCFKLSDLIGRIFPLSRLLTSTIFHIFFYFLRYTETIRPTNSIYQYLSSKDVENIWSYSSDK